MEDKLRTFIAIELDAEIKATVNSFELGIKPKSPPGLRWVKPEQLHLTLKFLGDITPAQVKEVTHALTQLSAATPRFQLQIAGTGAFPNWRIARTLWIGLGKSSELLDLFQHMDSALAGLGFLREGKPFSPHLTLCRVSDSVDPRLVQPLQKEFDGFSADTLPAWNVGEIIFFKSLLQAGGPIYTPLSRHPLK